MSNESDNTSSEAVGLQGFICPKKKGNKLFDYCFLDCPDQCEPLPVLMALSSHRKITPGVYSVTEILNPPQIIHLQRNFPYYVIPRDRAFMTFGSGWHKAVEGQKYRMRELGLSDDWILENNGKPFEERFDLSEGTAFLRGTPDLYHISKKVLWDFKTIKYYYSLKMILDSGDWSKETNHWQVNMYRKYCFPDAEKMILEAIVKDYNRRVMWKGIEPIVQLVVPFISDPMIENFVRTKLDYLLLCQKDPSKLRPCALEDIWVDQNTRSKEHGKPLRCLHYCGVSTICPQYKEYKDQGCPKLIF